MSTEAAIVRESRDGDVFAIAEIYAHYVRTSRATFETEAPGAEEIGRRRRDVVTRGLPYLVAESDGVVAGFAYAGVYRPRPAYRYTVEDSVYIRPDAVGKGIGRRLLMEVIAACQKSGARQMIAVIGGSDNTASIALHEKLSFRHVGVLRGVGYKFDTWVDTVLMQRELK